MGFSTGLAMRRMNSPLQVITLLICIAMSPFLYADKVTVAVASNFTVAAKKIAKAFENNSEHKIVLSFGSTGKLYTQILYNAPFDVFLSADQERPQLLEEEQGASLRFTFAMGRLVLWSSDAEREVSESALRKGDYHKLAVANPKTAPYGKAAKTVIQRLGVSEALKSKLVFGENISQTYQFVATGNAQMGLIALSHAVLNKAGKRWEVPQSLYEPIRQDAVLLRRGKENPAAKAFMDYLKSDAAKVIIHKSGYAVE